MTPTEKLIAEARELANVYSSVRSKMVIALCDVLEAAQNAQPLVEWCEDIGCVLWWKFPVDEPPYCGSPLDTDWPGYHTHWTSLIMPLPPKGEEIWQEQTCRICGCTWEHGCPGGCYWVEPDLCSQCAKKEADDATT